MCARGYPGRLVLAGPRMVNGSSRAEEAEFLRWHWDLAQRVVILPEVSEGGRAWLYRQAGLVLHPTLYEGFGLIPLEVALAGTPCLSSRAASLDEVLPRDIEVIDDWDPERIAERALGLLADPERRGRLVSSLAVRAREFTWARTAGYLVELFEEVCRAKPRPTVRAVQGEGGVMPRSLAPSRHPVAMLDGMYPPEVYQAMRAIGQREVLRRPLTGLTLLAYRLASSLRTRLARLKGDGASTSAPGGRLR
jgi:Glycosyl transferases group 1